MMLSDRPEWGTTNHDGRLDAETRTRQVTAMRAHWVARISRSGERKLCLRRLPVRLYA